MLWILFKSTLSRQFYNTSDKIKVLFGSIQPREFPAEAIPLNSLSFYKKVNKTQSSDNSFVDILTGNYLYDLGMNIPFGEKTHKNRAFGSILSYEDMISFNKYIENGYNYNIVIDGINLYAPIGQKIDGETKVFSRFEFTLSTNKNSIIDVKVNMINPKEMREGKSLEIYYTFAFEKTSVSYSNRMRKYLERNIFESQAHEYSSILSLLQMILFSLIIFTITKQMIKEFNSFNNEQMFDDFNEQNNRKGWRNLHGDVFRAPQKAKTLSVISGIGCCCATALFVTANIVFLTNNYGNRHSLLSIFIKVFILSGFISGIISTAIGKLMNERKWLHLSVFSSILPYVFLLSIAFIFAIFMHNKSSYFIISFKGITIFVIGSAISVLLSAFGGHLFNKNRILETNPQAVAIIPRRLPKLPFYMKPLFLCCLSCFIIGSCILPEFNFILIATFRGKVYYTFSYLVTAVMTSLCSAGLLSICITFFRLQHECYTWHWLSFCAPASSFVSLITYSIILFFKGLSNMSAAGIIVYFVSTTLLSLIIAVSCGGVGILASTIFVRIIYANLKIE